MISPIDCQSIYRNIRLNALGQKSGAPLAECRPLLFNCPEDTIFAGWFIAAACRLAQQATGEPYQDGQVAIEAFLDQHGGDAMQRPGKQITLTLRPLGRDQGLAFIWIARQKPRRRNAKKLGQLPECGDIWFTPAGLPIGHARLAAA